MATAPAGTASARRAAIRTFRKETFRTDTAETFAYGGGRIPPRTPSGHEPIACRGRAVATGSSRQDFLVEEHEVVARGVLEPEVLPILPQGRFGLLVLVRVLRRGLPGVRWRGVDHHQVHGPAHRFDDGVQHRVARSA